MQCGKGMSEQIVEGRGQPFGFTNIYKADRSFLSREKYILTTQADITFFKCVILIQNYSMTQFNDRQNGIECYSHAFTSTFFFI